MNNVTESIRTSSESNKGNAYVSAAKEFARKAKELAGSSNFLNRFADEVCKSMRKAESADCEYTAYTACNAAEIWLSKIEGVKTGKIRMSDLM